MKFKEYLKHLNELASSNPQVLDYVVVYSRDDEGNGFQTVSYKADVGHFDGDYSGDFTTEDRFEDGRESNAVCVN